ncbi:MULTISPECIES: response regulator [Marichromatium]|uniref:Two-component system chemotaxis response regulator CheY n=1 Tax=Marichromatium gracile TaxID=1048 RepID=A0A4R4ALC8_MARGR|nr:MULTISPECIES: response regulator [Marichromatium]MBO8085497.1 response regulator [Marichromatium sp.]MBK1710430.1 two-component system response regulator [Marichromatium gracile]RNE92246.1 response regulator [Marichromatium sp. AB31]RNE92653.1 response regulator [Marichromatium sp. AB32]TCW39626.1 two-component system chemotaxis response regulator CheY [Marichromatium gracile]
MKRILVIDDAATVRLYHRSILEELGFEVTEAVNGLEALERVAEGDFDLYLVDINMPKLDGYGFLRELRGKDMPQAPAIMVSTEAGANDQKLAFLSGANLYIVKPVRPERLASHVLTLLGMTPNGRGAPS